MESQPQDDILPWLKIFDYKDKLRDHFNDIIDRLDMVYKDEITKQVAEKRNKTSLIKFHMFLTKFLRDNNINPEQENEKESNQTIENVLIAMV